MRHKRRTTRRAKASLEYTCAWCLTGIPENHEHFGFGAKTKPDLDLSQWEGKWIDMQLVSAGRTVQAGVPPPDSPVRKEQGYHFYFVTCSVECCEKLQAAVAKDIELGRVLGADL